MAVEISNLPGSCAWIIARSWNQMQMQMSGALTEGDGINPFAAGDLLDKQGCALNNHSPLPRFLRGEIQRASTMSPRIQQTPTGQWCRLRVVTQKPEVIAPHLMGSQLGIVAVESTDCAGRLTLQKNHGHQGAT